MTAREIIEAEDPKSFLKRASADKADQEGEHQAERCFHLDARGDCYVLDWHGCIARYDWHIENAGGIYTFSGRWKFQGFSYHHWANHFEPWKSIRAKAFAGQRQRGYVWDLDHGTTRQWGGGGGDMKGTVYADSQWLRDHPHGL